MESSDEDETTTPTTKTTTMKLSQQERATALKEEGNKCYSNGQLDSAIAKYTQAMALDPSNPILPANRAMAYIKIEKYAAAEADCNKCLKLDSKYIKAYLRRGTSRIKLAKPEAAREDFQKVLGLEPWNKEAKKELEKLNKFLAGEKKGQVLDKDKKEIERDNSTKDAKPQGASQDKEKMTLPDASKTRKGSGDAKETQDKGSASSSQGSKTKAKKLKIEEVGFVNEDKSSSDPDVVTPIEKPPHLRSMKPLKRISVIDVPTCDAIGKLTTEETDKQDIQNSSVKVKPKTTSVDKSQTAEKTTTISAIPLPPRTSHQFSQDWLRLCSHQTRSIEYLKTIPPSFFNNVDLDTDVLVDVLRALASENVASLEAASYLTALAKSNEFAVNIMFLDSEQKKVLHNLMTKCKEEEKYSKEIKDIEKLLP
ncbi:RNA polymerase II-associated protein 3-like [Penaeus indicus]|uniref:RNA polymerase II-associated protein 3-like n=1 Tax=Penaeus indicus TaxID=29960 RepID=UPI00300CE251